MTEETPSVALGKLIAIARGEWSDPGTPPTDEPPGTCDWGGCDEWSAVWRYDDEHGGWLPVCAYHAA